MSNASIEKQRLRQQSRATLAKLPATTIQNNSQRIARLLLALPEFAAARSVFLYLASPPEVETMKLVTELLQRGREVAVPLLSGARNNSTMRAVTITGTSELQPGRFGIMAPAETAPECYNPDVVLVPGLAFDNNGGRLGRGAGYYDRWFQANPESRRVAIAHSVQLIDKVPMEQHDARMHIVVTERGITACPTAC